MKFLSKAFVFLLLVPVTLCAAERNDIPSCYVQTKLNEFQSPGSGRMLTVIVDQTTPLTVDLQKTAWGHIKRFINAGDKIRLYSFSAYLAGHYTQLQYAGTLEAPLDSQVIGNVPIMSAKKLDRCLQNQPALVWKSFGKVFANVIGKASSDIPRSEILFSLKEISADIRNASDVKENVVLILSDMLEYSDFGSFYVANNIRDINSAEELKKVQKQSLFADFSGARVYVHGAAFVPQQNKTGYRSGKLIRDLQSFWHDYFKQSNASLEGFGTPELTGEVQ